MNNAKLDAAILSLSLDRGSKTPLQSQLLQSLRDLVHAGRLVPGGRLPSSRSLAQELGVSRVTTTAVYDQLIAEGYLESRQRSSVYVSANLPDAPIRTRKLNIERQGETLPGNQPVQPFSFGYPDLAAFPYRDWTRINDRVWRAPAKSILGQSHPMGFGPLRSAVASHLREWRGIECTGHQVVITSGLVDALELISDAILTKPSNFIIEEPGHRILSDALTASGMTCIPVPVDQYGFNLAAADVDHHRPVAVAVTPSRQHPLGMTLTFARRLELLDWAKNNDGLILEDDYDGEFRYQGQPLPAMMSLDEGQSVIYIGSFSKVMFPGLRLGYMVLPDNMLSAVADALVLRGPRAAVIAQPVLDEFIRSGALATHIRRMRRLYSERQSALLAALDAHASGLLNARSEPGGMHLVAGLAPRLAAKMTDENISRLAQSIGVKVTPLSSFYFASPARQGLVMGYAAFEPHEITQNVQRLSQALRERVQ